MWDNIYKSGAALHRWLYSAGHLKSVTLNTPVIGVGNLAFGGTGKTMITAEIAQQLNLSGHKIGVVCRSYRAGDGPYLLDKQNHDPAIVGDEAAMLYEMLGADVIVASGKVKADAAQLLQQQHPRLNAIIVDDALQHHKLHKNLSLLVWHKPGSALRESLTSVRYADVVLVPNGFASPLDDAQTVYFVRTSSALNNGSMSGKNVLAVCGLGENSSLTFFSAGAKLCGTFGHDNHARFSIMKLPDHVDYQEPVTRSKLINAAKDKDCIITTAKDAVKMRKLQEHLPPIKVLDSRIKFLSNESLLFDRIEEVLRKHP